MVNNTHLYYYISMRKIFLFLSLLLTGVLYAHAQATTHSFEIKGGQFIYDGRPIQLHCGEMHPSRVPASYWRHRLKMIKAMGMNAVAAYVMWNHHETAPGVWDWTTDNHNLRLFVREAQEEGLLVILRPGPYVCAEWDYGGFPWWLQNVKGMEVRTYNKPFLDSCRVYLRQLATQVKDLQVTHGGPIILVQVENEFGSYVAQKKNISEEQHRQYRYAMLKMLEEEGFDAPKFTADGDWLFNGGAIKGVLPCANGEDNVDNLKKTVNAYNNGQGPYFVSEFYPGWLDHWNEKFVSTSIDSLVKHTKAYLDAGVSFNYYVIHGGTNFGFTAGANFTNDKNIQPDITSYDYDSPISEAGWATPKYGALRALMMQYVDNVPEVPQRIPTISIPEIQFEGKVDLFSSLSQVKPVKSNRLLTMEELNQGHGYVVYRFRTARALKGKMSVPGLADFATVYVNGRKIGQLSRVTEHMDMDVDIPKGGTLDLLVENLGRINYGARITDNHKGITQPITIDGKQLKGTWLMYRLPMDKMPEGMKKTDNSRKGMPVLLAGTFLLDKVGDTFLDMENWGKGIVFVNGHNLGRYWKVGPQQTLYLPGCFLKKGDNHIVVFEQLNDEEHPTLKGITTPKLNVLKAEPYNK